MMNKATLITMTAAEDQGSELANFLRAGRDGVARDEPQTRHWLALQREDAPERFGIFDTFDGPAGRRAHFEGQVASALRDAAPRLVEGAWEEGVLANVANFDGLAARTIEGASASKATCIMLRAREGQGEALAAFLTQGAALIEETEPDTPFWWALRSESDPSNFAIFDLFTDDAGRAAHFAGKVAAALCAQAEVLIEGGWERGVLAKVAHFDVVAAK